MRAGRDANPIASSSSLWLFKPQVVGWFWFAKGPLLVTFGSRGLMTGMPALPSGADIVRIRTKVRLVTRPAGVNDSA